MLLIQICPAHDELCEKLISEISVFYFLQLQDFAQHGRNFYDLIDYAILLLKFEVFHCLPSYAVSLILWIFKVY